MPSCASLLTSTAVSSRAVFTPAPRFCSGALASSIVLQHIRPFVLKVFVKELSIRSIIIRWGYPFPWYDAWEGHADASGTIEPAWRWAAGEFLAEVGGEVVAVFCEQVVGSALKSLRGLSQVSVGLLGREMTCLLDDSL